MTTLLIAPTTPSRPDRPARIRAALRRAGRAILDDLATDNGWCWAYGIWYPHPALWSRSQPRHTCR